MGLNVKNRTIFEGDNLEILRGVNSDSVDLIYLDPPFNSNRNYSAPIGSEAAGAAFKDTWTLSDVDNAWVGEIADKDPALYNVIQASEHSHGKGMKSYLIMMAVRLLELKRVLKPTGSIYLHIDPTASHYLKLVMDAIFGNDAFFNEIVWNYNKWTNTAKYFQRNHDVVLAYGKSKLSQDRVFNKQYGEPTKRQQEIRKRGYNVGSSKGQKIVRIYDKTNPAVKKKLGDGSWQDHKIYEVAAPNSSPMSDVWDISVINGRAKERTGYPTQKPLALLERIIKASSNEGDVVLDPFCGCATTCVASEKLNRQWVGIDLSSLAVKLVKERLSREVFVGEGSGFKFFGDVIHRTDIPIRTDIEKLPSYKTHKHTLFGLQEGKCNGCDMMFPFQNFTTDHIVPVAKGGTDHIENLQLLCNSCNSIKGKRTQEELIVALKEKGFV